MIAIIVMVQYIFTRLAVQASYCFKTSPEIDAFIKVLLISDKSILMKYIE